MNGKSKKKALTAAEQQEARDVLVAKGHSHRSAAAEMFIHPSLLSQIINGSRPCSDEVFGRIMSIRARRNIPNKSYIGRAKMLVSTSTKGHGE